MPRRASNSDDFLDLLSDGPLWAGPLVAGIVYAGMRWLPSVLLQPDDRFGVDPNLVVGGGISSAAHYGGLAVLAVWILARLKRISTSPPRTKTNKSIAHGSSHLEAEFATKPDGTSDQSTPPVCNSCHAAMVLRTAKKGPTTGTRFWGCSNYPACRHTINIPAL